MILLPAPAVRTSVVAAATAALTLPALLGVAGPARAAGGCAPNETRYSVSAVRAQFVLTHLRRAFVPANTEATFEGGVPAVRVITSRVEYPRGGDAATVHRLAQTAAKQRGAALTLAKPGTRTEPGPLDSGSTTFGRSPKAVRYAQYHAYRVWDGRWTRTDCGSTGRTSSAYGATWRSFEKPPVSGEFNCDAPASATPSRLRDVRREACALAYR
jgi:hypothetical protein